MLSLNWSCFRFICRQLQTNLNEIISENRSKEENIQQIKLDYRTKKTQYEDKCEEYQRISIEIKHKISDKSSIQASLDDIEK